VLSVQDTWNVELQGSACSGRKEERKGVRKDGTKKEERKKGKKDRRKVGRLPCRTDDIAGAVRAALYLRGLAS
jgi:hypothetical protein